MPLFFSKFLESSRYYSISCYPIIIALLNSRLGNPCNLILIRTSLNLQYKLNMLGWIYEIISLLIPMSGKFHAYWTCRSLLNSKFSTINAMIMLYFKVRSSHNDFIFVCLIKFVSRNWEPWNIYIVCLHTMFTIMISFYVHDI